MTTEIAILNKSGISLAADSAVTIGIGNKFYNTANKLFMLSKYQPVGIMIYSNAEFMGYPIEIVIKEYRKKLGDKFFDDITGYWNDFVYYLENDLPIENEMDDFEGKIQSFINYVDSEIRKYSESRIWEYYNSEEIDKNTEQNQAKLNEIVKECLDEVISTIYENYKSLEDDEKFIDDFEFIKEKIEDNIKIIIDEIIGEISGEQQEKIIEMCTMILTKQHHNGSRTGIVIAGFGKNNMFPVLISGEFMGVYFSKLKYTKNKETRINNNTEASVIPFAQADVIATFMTGIDQDLHDNILDTIEDFKSNTCEDKDCVESLKNRVKQDILLWSEEKHINPIMDTITIAPKEELAQMAETLVNLTSFRKNLSMDVYSQSVGGPIDVALITKSDGFIWIKRKHYFDLNKNQHFYKNYFK